MLLAGTFYALSRFLPDTFPIPPILILYLKNRRRLLAFFSSIPACSGRF
jgi:hypothetical protein